MEFDIRDYFSLALSGPNQTPHGWTPTSLNWTDEFHCDEILARQSAQTISHLRHLTSNTISLVLICLDARRTGQRGCRRAF